VGQLAYTGSRASWALSLRRSFIEPSSYVAKADVADVVDCLGTSSFVGRVAAFALPIGHLRGAAKEMNAERLSLPKKGCRLDVSSWVRPVMPSLADALDYPGNNFKPSVLFDDYPRACIMCSRKHFMDYLHRLWTASILYVACLSKIPRGRDGNPIIAGLFAVVKDILLDRAITDRRPLNMLESDPWAPALAHSCLITRMTLWPDRALRFYVSDLPDFFHHLYGGLEHALHNALGYTFKTREFRDAGITISSEVNDDTDMIGCLTSVGMGDKKAVSVAQLLHLIVVKVGGLRAPLMQYNQPVPNASVIGGIVVDDLALLCDVPRPGPDYVPCSLPLPAERGAARDSLKPLPGEVPCRRGV
jgi:hypothetical protein